MYIWTESRLSIPKKSSESTGFFFQAAVVYTRELQIHEIRNLARKTNTSSFQSLGTQYLELVIIQQQQYVYFSQLKYFQHSSNEKQKLNQSNCAVSSVPDTPVYLLILTFQFYPVTKSILQVFFILLFIIRLLSDCLIVSKYNWPYSKKHSELFPFLL